MPQANLTKSFVDRLKLTTEGRITYTDQQLKGLLLIVGQRAAVWYLQRDMKGRTRRKRIGPTEQFTPREARAEAMDLIARVKRGEDIFAGQGASAKAYQSAGISLDDALERYIRRRDLKPNTETFYRTVLRCHCGDWLKEPLKEITLQMIEERHDQVTLKSPYAANRMIAIIGAIWEHSEIYDDNLPANPARKARRAGIMNKEFRRDAAINADDLPAWRRGVERLADPVHRDYLYLLLYTGLRRREASTLRWEQVSFEAATITIQQTKNGKALTLPITRQLHSLLEQRRTGTNGPWVFPSHSKSGHLEEPKSFVQRVRNVTGLDFTVHGLRNTFITIARRHLLLDAAVVKRLVNHAPSRDVTEGYAAAFTLEQLRRPSQMIADELEHMLTGHGRVYLGRYNTESADHEYDFSRQQSPSN